MTGISDLKVLVTGGAGFVGSHLVDRLMTQNSKVKVLDNLSSGSLGNVKSWLGNENFTFMTGDLKEPRMVEKVVKDVELLFHFAANPVIRVGEKKPSIHFEENLATTFHLLEALRKERSLMAIVFASSSTVYGEVTLLPTPEDYGPLVPISIYGASKLACEALISAYAHTFGLRGLILRLANIVGSKAASGVIVDFIRKLKSDSNRLEILGDGTQKKSYLYIDDCIDAVFCATNEFLNCNKRVDTYNIGSSDSVTAMRIAEIVAQEMGLNPDFIFTGGVDGGRGWRGDVKNMLLSVEKLLEIGWRSKYNSEGAVRAAVERLVKNRER